MPLDIKICAINKTLYEGEAESVTLPGADGELGILPSHTPLITSLKHGTIQLRSKNEEKLIDIAGGFAEVQPGSRVVILAD